VIMFAAKPRSQRFVEVLASEEATAVDLRRPKDHEIFRVSPDPRFHTAFPLLVTGGERRSLWWVLGDSLEREVEKMAALHDYFLLATVSTAGVAFLWPIRSMDRPNKFLTTAADAARDALVGWVRPECELPDQCYT